MKKSKLFLLFLLTVLMSSCSSLLIKPLEKTKATVFLKNNTQIKGDVIIPNKKIVRVNNKKFKTEEVEKVIIENTISPETPYELNFEKAQVYGKVWVAKICESENLNAYTCANGYSIDENGELQYTGYRSVTRNGNGSTSTSAPTFGILLKKKTDDKLTSVGELSIFKKSNDGYLRSRISRYLKDDPKLCQYIRSNKIGFNELCKITELYTPNRGDKKLVVDGKEIDLTLEKLKNNKNFFRSEMVWFFEYAKPFSDYKFSSYTLGLKYYKKYTVYGLNFGACSSKNVGFLEHTNNHLYDNDLVSEEDYINSTQVSLNFFYGAYKTIQLDNYFLMPTAYLHLETRVGEVTTINYGPKLELNLGKKYSVGNALMFGIGYKYSFNKEFNTEDYNYGTGGPEDKFGTLSFNVSYKY